MTALDQLVALADEADFALTVKRTGAVGVGGNSNYGSGEEWEVRLISNEVGGNLRKLYKNTSPVLEIAAEGVLMEYEASTFQPKDVNP